MPSAATDVVAAAVPGAPRSPGLAQFADAARRLVLAGYPRTAQPQGPRAELAVQRPKEVLLALAAALAAAEGLLVERLNPHFTPAAEWDGALAVAHFCPLELTCPLPLARNVLLLDGEDLLVLAEERRAEGEFGLQRRRVQLMDAVLSVAPPRATAGDLLPPVPVRPAPLAALLDVAAWLPAPGRRGLGQPGGQPGTQSVPVQWMRCDLETGHYNFLELKRHPKLGSSHARVLLDAAQRGGQPALVGFATATTLAELGPALRTFAALRCDAVAGGGGPQFFVFFFGGPEEFAAALAARPDALFFGDNFRCPAIRFLFAPFSAPDLLEAVRRAAATVDCCYGGVLDALARGLGVANRVVLGPDGGFDAETPGGGARRGVAWDAVLAPGMLARRRQKADRSAERVLADVLEAML